MTIGYMNKIVLVRGKHESHEAFKARIHSGSHNNCYYLGWEDMNCDSYAVCGGWITESGLIKCDNCSMNRKG